MAGLGRCHGLIAGAVLLAGCGGPPEVTFDVRATETVWCADQDGVVDTILWNGHDGTLTDIDVKVVELAAGYVTKDDLIEACSRPIGRLLGVNDTLCEVYTEPVEVERFADAEFVTAVHGELTKEQRPGFPVVVRGSVNCDEITLKVDSAATVTVPDVAAHRLRPWNSTDAFNRWRAVERRFAEAASDACLAIDQARRIALAGQADLAGDWPVIESARGADDEWHAELCFDVRLHRSGTIWVEYQTGLSPAVLVPLGDMADQHGICTATAVTVRRRAA